MTQTKGIRILDKKNRIVTVDLFDILEEIEEGNQFNWSILDLYGTGTMLGNLTIEILEQEIKDAKNGLFISWEKLCSLSKKIPEIIDISIIGCKDKKKLHFMIMIKKCMRVAILLLK